MESVCSSSVPEDTSWPDCLSNQAFFCLVLSLADTMSAAGRLLLSRTRPPLVHVEALTLLQKQSRVWECDRYTLRFEPKSDWLLAHLSRITKDTYISFIERRAWIPWFCIFPTLLLVVRLPRALSWVPVRPARKVSRRRKVLTQVCAYWLCMCS